MFKRFFHAKLVLPLASVCCFTTANLCATTLSPSTPLLMQPALADDQVPLPRAVRIAHIYNNTSSAESVPELANLLNETTKSTGLEADLKTAARNIFYAIYTGEVHIDISANLLVSAYFGAFDRAYGEYSPQLLQECQEQAIAASEYDKTWRRDSIATTYAMPFYLKAVEIQEHILRGTHSPYYSYERTEDNYEAMAAIQEKLGHFDEAQATIEQAIAYLNDKPYDPLPNLLLKLSTVQEHAGKLSESLASANAALASLNNEELKNGTPDIIEEQIARIQELQQNYPEAQRVLEQLLQKAIKNNNFTMDHAYRSLAELFVRRKQYQTAIDTYEKLLWVYEKDHPAGYEAEQLRRTIDDLRQKLAQGTQTRG